MLLQELKYHDNPWELLPLLMFGAVLLGITAVLYVYNRNNPTTTKPVRVKRPVDYSIDNHDRWADFAHQASTPEQKTLAAREALGSATYDSIVASPLEPVMPFAPTASTRYQGMVFVNAPPQTTAPSAPVAQAPIAPRPVFFKDGEPETLEGYEGQRHVVDYLQAVVDGLPSSEVNPREHQLFLGPAGLGKTLLAKCFANTLAKRNEALGLEPVWFQEEFPADLPDLKALDRAIQKASQRPTLLFIDEIHDLKSEGHFLKLYLLMEEGRYKFEGDPFPVEVPNICIVGATTDYGALHAALQRRFNRHALQPLNRQQITMIVQSRAFPVTPEATTALVDRTHFSGAPWEALQLYRQAMQFARQRKAKLVQLEDVERVFKSQQIDTMGLRWMDRAVVRVLLGMPKWRANKAKPDGKEFVCYAASEQDTCVMAQIDKGEYRESIKPRLMSRGLLMVRATYGQALTPAAETTYGWLATTPKVV